MNVNEIMKQALDLGACTKSEGVTDWKTLAWLFFTPQGEEFCTDNNFPSLEVFRQMDRSIREFGVLVDDGKVTRTNDKNIAIVGETEAELVFTDNQLHKVIVMHGAKVKLVVRNYSVVRLVNISGDKVWKNKDKTAVILE